MTDQTIPDLSPEDAEAARDWASHVLRQPRSYFPMEQSAARALQALLPRPTLADMTDEERAECQWMQADVAGHSTRYVIINPHEVDDAAVLIAADGLIEWVVPVYVTPRPDLPRIEWPGNTPAPALPEGWRLADHPEHGRIIVTSPTSDEEGFVAFVHRAAYLKSGSVKDWCTPEELTFLDGNET